MSEVENKSIYNIEINGIEHHYKTKNDMYNKFEFFNFNIFEKWHIKLYFAKIHTIRWLVKKGLITKDGKIGNLKWEEQKNGGIIYKHYFNSNANMNEVKNE